MGLLTIVEPAIEPVTLAQAYGYLRETPGADDLLVGSLITAARRWCEVYTQRRFITQTVRLLMDFFPGTVDMRLAGARVSSPFVSGSNAVLVGIRYAILLPYPPVSSIAQFVYQDANGNPQQLIPATNYIQDLASQPARLTPLFGQMWPVARVVVNAVFVDYICGYGGPLTGNGVSIAASSAVTSGYAFLPTDAGRPLIINGAGKPPAQGQPGGPLCTTILSVDGSGNATLAIAATTTVTNAQGYLGEPVPNMINIAILLLVSNWYERRLPDDTDIPMAVKSILAPYRDLRL